MAKHNETGKKGEKLAISWLIQQGYRILARNWRYKRSEIDIVALTGKIMVIVEVKTRSSSGYGRPSDFVGPGKMRLLIDAATQYAIEMDHDGEIRFDIIGIEVLKTGSYRLRHLKDAFFPDMEFDRERNI